MFYVQLSAVLCLKSNVFMGLNHVSSKKRKKGTKIAKRAISQYLKKKKKSHFQSQFLWIYRKLSVWELWVQFDSIHFKLSVKYLINSTYLLWIVFSQHTISMKLLQHILQLLGWVWGEKDWGYITIKLYLCVLLLSSLP